MSSNPPKILKAIRAFFLGFRWLFVISLLVLAYKLVVGPMGVTATVGVAPQAFPPAVNSAAPGAPLQFGGLKAAVVLPVGNAADPELKSVARIATIPWMAVAALAGLVLCEIVQRLVRNLEAGEMFSEANRKLLRNFAFVLVGATLLDRIAIGWGNHVFGHYAASHLTVGGARVLPLVDSVAITEFQLNFGNHELLVVLLLLLIVWAFKEGAAIKRDTDLTI
ncbi:MAG TPA: DUF2975 domain-containing protein [Lacunisphaera sp.]|nr:DUF2975 domain-containing protein [Lacunisphaera sp.]